MQKTDSPLPSSISQAEPLNDTDLIDEIIQKWQATDISEGSYIGTKIIGRMVRMNAFIQQQIDDNLARHKMNIGDFNLLAVLLREAPQELTPGRIQELILVSSGGLSNRMARLEARNLIARLPDPTDRRGVIVKLTSEGQALIEAAAPTHLALENQLVEKLSEEEQNQLITLLKKMLHQLEA